MSTLKVNSQTEEVVFLDGSPTGQSRKSIKLLEAFCMTFGMIIGSGIFISVYPTFIVFDSNSIGMVLIFWLFGGLVAIVGGLCYAELGTRIPESGGERAYYEHILNKKFSITYVVAYIFLVKGITLAALALTTGKYLATTCSFLQAFRYSERLIGLVTLILCFFVNCLSKKAANKTNIFFTFLKILALVVIIGFGIYYLITGEAKDWEKPFDVVGFDFKRLTICFINVFWSYEGWNMLGMVAGDMKNPSRDLPLALISGITAVIFFYLLANISYSAILGYETVRNSQTVAMAVSNIVLSKVNWLIPILICCSTAGSVNGNLYATGNVAMSAGYRGNLPRMFSLVQKNSRTPIFALLIELVIACIFLTQNFEDLLGYAAFISWMFYFISLCCLLKVKFSKKPVSDDKIFKVPTLLIFPFQIVCIFTVVMCFVIMPVGCGIFTAIIVGVFLFMFIPERYRSFKCFSIFQNYICYLSTSFCGLEYANENDVS